MYKKYMSQPEKIYDPVQFVGQLKVFTFVIIASFVTWKFFNAIYDNLYEPLVDVIIDSDETDKYYIKIGKYYVQTGLIFKEAIKWIIIIIALMMIYNMILHFKSKKN
jgi:large-conductance mechanosensitive channel